MWLAGAGLGDSVDSLDSVLPMPYLGSMIGMAHKRKVSITLDEDLVSALEGEGDTLSAQVNSAVRAEVERRARQRLLRSWLDEMEAYDGPVDEALVASFEELLA